VVGVVTGLVASVMLDESEETKALHARLERIESLLEGMTSPASQIETAGESNTSP